MSPIVEGLFEPNGKTGGFLRSADAYYRVRASDVRIPGDLCQTHMLRGGEMIAGTVAKRPNEKRGAAPLLTSVETINDRPPDDRLDTKPFEDLTPIDPSDALRFEIPDGSLSMRVVDLMTPIGLGQRGLIVAPPRTGKTILLQQMAKGVAVTSSRCARHSLAG